jgi:hypothetical protein
MQKSILFTNHSFLKHIPTIDAYHDLREIYRKTFVNDGSDDQEVQSDIYAI